jgi:hypothetical protein
MAKKISIIEKLKPFLAEGVDLKFKELRAWQHLVFVKGDQVLTLSATGDEGGYYQTADELPDWYQNKSSAAAQLPVVPAQETRSFFMRNGQMTGPLERRTSWDTIYFVDSNDDNETHGWETSGRYRTMHDSDEVSEFDLVEMVQSRLFPD